MIVCWCMREALLIILDILNTLDIPPARYDMCRCERIGYRGMRRSCISEIRNPAYLLDRGLNIQSRKGPRVQLEPLWKRSLW